MSTEPVYLVKLYLLNMMLTRPAGLCDFVVTHSCVYRCKNTSACKLHRKTCKLIPLINTIFLYYVVPFIVSVTIYNPCSYHKVFLAFTWKSGEQTVAWATFHFGPKAKHSGVLLPQDADKLFTSRNHNVTL